MIKELDLQTEEIEKEETITHSVSDRGDQYWKDEDGQYHREDGPAVELIEGDKIWYKHGKIHRIDGPAIESANGDKEWFANDVRHRDDGPAVVKSTIEGWYKRGVLHRADGPAEITKYNDTSRQIHRYYHEGLLHRTDGPAVEWSDGQKEWFKDGKRHRENGPAVDDFLGKSWYLDGKFIKHEPK